MVRHGESAWNAENRFCGWHDADLAESGIAEAKLASQVSIKTNHDKCISILKLLMADNGGFALYEDTRHMHVIVDVSDGWLYTL